MILIFRNVWTKVDIISRRYQNTFKTPFIMNGAFNQFEN